MESLPSRNRPLRSREPSRSRERTFRAKSDWYWRIGARDRIAVELRSPQVAQAAHHELVAGLYCLAVAEALARHLKRQLPAVAAVGSDDGVYVIMSDVAARWEVPVREIGVKAGELRPKAFSCELPEAYPVRVLTPSTAEEPSPVRDTVMHPNHGPAPKTAQAAQNADDQEFKGDKQLLVLNDPGGIWEKHNDWLVELDEPVCVKTLDSKQEVVPLKRASGGEKSGQWVSVNKDQTPLKLARARGCLGEHLKKDDSVAIDVELLDSPDEP